MAIKETTVLKLDAAALADIKAAGFVMVSVSGKSYKLAIKDITDKIEANETAIAGKAPTSHTHTASQITDLPSVPTKTSDLTNDSGFTTKTYVDGLVGDVETLLAAL